MQRTVTYRVPHPVIAPASLQTGITKIEWILIVLIAAIVVSVLVATHREGEQTRRHMEAAAIPLIEALDRYRAANKSYPDTLQKLVPVYLPELPRCNPRSTSSGIAYNLDKDSGEYYLNCGIGMFGKRQYSSKGRKWNKWD
jgi:Tfp pilus assembly protein PilE